MSKIVRNTATGLMGFACLIVVSFSGAEAWAGHFPWKAGETIKDGDRTGVIVRLHQTMIDPVPPPPWVLSGGNKGEYFSGPEYQPLLLRLPGPPSDPEERAKWLVSLEWWACKKAAAEADDGTMEKGKFRAYLQTVRIVSSGHPSEVGKIMIRSFCSGSPVAR
ncbi:MAG: Hypothetical protein C75L2_00240003 [Leptospirillum sp. Group II 'C75']|jgi:hypothetical protein|uniref:Uncharacterized protein n=1 Tax=Leptospirillum sp. Group II '5-way CG' TaxID=419541 RepID=B6AKT9_9BACT|nr:hypothetical protein [Leptospirillum sp. Group II 'CF-1']AKS24313.1 hypothetical protein ABH19_11970 [Leptospirillum sp. Group II 'CF-1']EAY56635.1 MAG: hypothetical protein UBAL2_80620280 [Leptospirillum rubarum]EDZ40193.1 MAG: Hypothetical protein CGL2_11364055 [Leptospirillum sp. Group II '5-way CG']EIJ77260.1 MAG: Hypothetical protein C75L2_00240003 [Leptospirillum sp. Group II 'C75']